MGAVASRSAARASGSPSASSMGVSGSCHGAARGYSSVASCGGESAAARCAACARASGCAPPRSSGPRSRPKAARGSDASGGQAPPSVASGVAAEPEGYASEARATSAPSQSDTMARASASPSVATARSALCVSSATAASASHDSKPCRRDRATRAGCVTTRRRRCRTKAPGASPGAADSVVYSKASCTAGGCSTELGALNPSALA